MEDWAKQIDWRNRAPAGVAEAGAILDRLLPEFEASGSQDARERTLKVVAKIPGAVAQFKDLMERARTCSRDDRWHSVCWSCRYQTRRRLGVPGVPE